jgi:threonine/homoserine/homoserine lactone efflux protein
MHDLALAFGLGVALAAGPGPVQLLLLTESARGGVRRGLAAMAGSAGALTVLFLAVAWGVSVAAPRGGALRVLKLAAGVFLVVLAILTALASRRGDPGSVAVRGLHPFVRGVLAVVLNPGVWLFLATAGSGLAAAATADGGRPLALATALVTVAGVVVADAGAVVVGSAGRRLPEIWRRRVPYALAAIEALLGSVFIAGAFLG